MSGICKKALEAELPEGLMEDTRLMSYQKDILCRRPITIVGGRRFEGAMAVAAELYWQADVAESQNVIARRRIQAVARRRSGNGKPGG